VLQSPADVGFRFCLQKECESNPEAKSYWGVRSPRIMYAGAY
jgi:hypothetical protein